MFRIWGLGFSVELTGEGAVRESTVQFIVSTFTGSIPYNIALWQQLPIAYGKPLRRGLGREIDGCWVTPGNAVCSGDRSPEPKSRYRYLNPNSR